MGTYKKVDPPCQAASAPARDNMYLELGECTLQDACETMQLWLACYAVYIPRT